jgi:hypothetical protein
LLPYVECDPRGAGAQPARCDQASVRKYPTWMIRGTRHEGVMTLHDLAKASGFELPPSH